MTEQYDLIVIGSGPAGEKGAAQAAYHGNRVALVERQPWVGGAAVGNAGIPTKTMRETASYITGFRKREIYGVAPELDPFEIVQHLRARARDVFETMSAAVRANLDRHGIEIVQGRGELSGKGTLRVTGGPDERVLQAPVVLIATGSRPQHPAQVPFGDEDVMDSEQVFELEVPFSSLVVVGGAAIGCEYASIFAAAGAEVTLIDRSERLLKMLDAEISHQLAESFRALGMRVILGGGTRPVVKRDGGGIAVALPDGEVLRPDKVLYAAGRTGNTEGLGLEKAGVDVDTKGRIVVDDRFRTSAEGIYAAGDVIGPPSLASVSMEQARLAMCHAFGIPLKQALDPVPPLAVYSIPEAAMVGLSTEAAASAGLDFEVGRALLSRNARATISGATDGMVKLVFERATRRLLGVHILSEDASELVHVGQAVIQYGGTIDHFIESTFAVPTLSDAYKYAAYDGLAKVGR